MTPQSLPRDSNLHPLLDSSSSPVFIPSIAFLVLFLLPPHSIYDISHFRFRSSFIYLHLELFQDTARAQDKKTTNLEPRVRLFFPSWLRMLRRDKNPETRSSRPSRQHGFTLVAFKQGDIRARVSRNVHLKVAEESSGMAEDGGKHQAVYVSRRERRQRPAEQS